MFSLALALLTLAEPAQKPDKQIYQAVERDAILAIENPVFVSAEEADKFMSDRELVIGLFDGTTAKAYSAWALEAHEIVNDHLGERPVAVTW